MPLTPSGARTFLNALSDFWNVFFRDRATLDAYAEGIAVDAAQLYESLLEAALDISLRDMALFDRVFFQALALREDELVYREGPTPDEDTYRLPGLPGLVAAEYLVNRIIAPTAFLTSGREFRVESGTLVFRANPFTNFGESLGYFATRQRSVIAPSAWKDPAGQTWADAQPGDLARIRIGNAVAEVPITRVQASTLYLKEAPTTLQQTVARRGADVVVLREPFDPTVNGRLLPTHPLEVLRVSARTEDASLSPGTSDLTLAGEPSYQGAWTSSTAYAAGDLVDEGGQFYSARVAHTSSVSFDATLWDNLSTGYFYLEVPDDPRLDGVYASISPTGSGTLTLQVPEAFVAALRARLYRVVFSVTPTGNRPQMELAHTYVRPETFQVATRRAIARKTVDAQGNVTTHPAGGSVQQGVDYLVEPDTGRLTVLSVWDPSYAARASYAWRLAVARHNNPWRGVLTSIAYEVGDLVTSGSTLYVVTVAHVGDGGIDSRFTLFREPAAFEVAHEVREIATWATDALLDQERLYKIYGHLLDRPRATSEAYRVFLMAVSRLFLLGPSLDKFESALNAVAQLPLIRDDGEVLRAYSDGIEASGNDATVYGLAAGHDGVLVNSTSRFESPTAQFLDTDAGSALRVVRNGRAESYVIASVVNATTVVISPAPADGTDLQWEYRHAIMSDRLRLLGGSHRFSEADVGGWIQLASTSHEHNRGLFRIVSIDDPLTAVLESEFGFVDEFPLVWKLSRTGQQTVTTTRRQYDFPLAIPLRPDVKLPGNVGVLRFNAFEALSDAFSVVDYLEDPKWWHHVTIPEELMPEASGARRTVTPELVEHIYGALDGAQYNDLGLAYGRDDEGRASTPRSGEAVWYGGEYVVLNFAAEVPSVRARDVGHYLHVRDTLFQGPFKIQSLESDGVTVRLERFPPRAARHLTAPQRFQVELSPLLYRRSVAFLIMDRMLKYHSIQVRVDPAVGLSPELIEDTIRIVDSAKPSHVFVFFETPTTFRDALAPTDETELGLTFHPEDVARLPNALITYGPPGLLRYGDAFRFVARSTSLTPTPGLTQNLPTVLPGGTSPVRTLVKVMLEDAARVGGRRPAENVDYTVDYVAGTVTVNPGVTITPSPVTVYYVDCIRRILAPADPHDPEETSLVMGGTDPTFVRASDQNADVTGLVDRAIQLTLGP